MNSLKGRILLVLGVTLLLLVVLGETVFGVLSWRTQSKESMRTAEVLAKTVASLSMAEFAAQDDHDRVSHRIVQTIAASHPQVAVVIFGRSGKVLGAMPAKPGRVEYAVDPDCKICHADSASLKPSAIGERGDGTKVAFALAPISADAGWGCKGCHAAANRPLGYAYVQMSAEELFENALDEILITGAALLLICAGLFFLGRRYLFSLVVKPVEEMVGNLKGMAEGRAITAEAAGTPREMDGVYDQFEAAIRRQGETEARTPLHLEQLDLSAAVIRKMLQTMKSNMDVEREYAWQLDRTLTKLASEIRDVNSSVDLIAASSNDNSSSLSELTESVNKVAADAEQLSLQVKRSTGSLGQMTRSVQAVAEHVDLLVSRVSTASGKVRMIETSASEITVNAREASALSGDMANSAVVGAEAVGLISDSISSSYQEIIVAAESMRELKKASMSVGGILKIINEINDKTKLLALNAAIIAAQAGEQGRSFAVVAHEIKGLSDRTAASTGDIARIIDTIQAGVDRALGNVSRGEERLSGSVSAVSQAGMLLGGIASTASDTYDKIRLITDAAERQTTFTKEVGSAVSQVAGMTDEIKRRVKEHGSGAEFVESSAQSMGAVTDQVRIAAKEQAETSRYLSEAFTIIDLHLKGVLKIVAANGVSIEDALREVGAAKSRTDTYGRAVADSESALDELERKLKELAESLGESDGMGKA